MKKLALLLFILAIAASTAHAQFTGGETHYEVTGTLVNEKDEPVAHHPVMLYNEKDELIAEDDTDNQGRFTLSYPASPTSVEPGDRMEGPSAFRLGHSYPNPFNPMAFIPFEAPGNARVRIAVYDLLGRQVMQTSAEVSRGRHEIVVNLGSGLSQGRYILRVYGEGFSESETMTFVSAGTGSGSPKISIRSGSRSAANQALRNIEAGEIPQYRLVIKGTGEYRPQEIIIPANENYDIGMRILTFVGREDVSFKILRQMSGGQATTGAPSPVRKCSFNLSNIDMPNQDVPPEELSGIELVISNQEDFEHYIACDEDAIEIDLDTDFILAGMTTGQPHEVYIEHQGVIFTSDTLRYNVGLWKLNTTKPDRAQYIVMVPNAYGDYPVDFNIYWEKEFIGACPVNLFDTVKEKGFVRIMFDLIMEDYVPESELDEEEIKKQREAVAALLDEFLDTMKDMNISVHSKGIIEPWLAMSVEDEQALNFICRHEMVKVVEELIPETTF